MQENFSLSIGCPLYLSNLSLSSAGGAADTDKRFSCYFIATVHVLEN
jgi:hypothetical protein